MLHIDHRLLACRIHRRIRREQEHILLHAELGQVIVRLADRLAVLERADQLDHVAVVFVQAGALEDLVPAAVGDFWLVCHHVIHVGLGASHAGPEEEEHAACGLDEVGFLCLSDGRLGEEDRMPQAGVGAVDEEEVVPGLVGGSLCTGCDVD